MISVVIVTYNSREHVGRCLESLQRHATEIVVVDNASADGTPEVVGAFPAVKLIVAPRNLGFAAGANLGARSSGGDALLFVNPDVECLAPLSELQDVLDGSPGVTALAPRLVDADGRPQVGFNVRRLPTAAALIFEILTLNRFFPRNPVNRNYRCLGFNYARAAEIEQPAAACLLVRRSSFEQCGGFDERFFPLWFEDVDLCLRLRQGGGRILYWPHVAFRHAGAHSLESITFSERQVYWYRNLLYYVRKHFSRGAGVAIRASLLLGVALRALAESPHLVGGGATRTPAPRERVWAYVRAAKLSLLSWKQ